MTTVPRAIARRRSGFSLAELLIAIGILSVGLSMSAALFPAALKEHERAANNVLGNIICENALAMGKVVFQADDNVAPVQSYEIADTQTSLIDKTGVLGAGQQEYPLNPGNSTLGNSSPLGCFLLVRKSGEVHQLMAVSYRNQDTDQDGKPKGTVVLEAITCNISADGKTVTNSTAKLRIGSPLIIRGNGEFATLESVYSNRTQGTLSHALSTAMQGQNNVACYVVRQSDDIFVASPALSVLTIRTGLRK